MPCVASCDIQFGVSTMYFWVAVDLPQSTFITFSRYRVRSAETKKKEKTGPLLSDLDCGSIAKDLGDAVESLRGSVLRRLFIIDGESTFYCIAAVSRTRS
jgi:hypothetical protein